MSCLQVRRIELSIVASPLIAQCVEPSIGALSGQGGLYDVPPSGSSQPTSTPSLQNRLQEPSARLVAVDTTYMQCGINKGPTRPAYSDVMIVPGTACFPVSSSREANWEFQVPTSSIITSLGSKHSPGHTHLKLLHSYHSRSLVCLLIAPHCIAFRLSGGWDRSSRILIPAPSLASSHSLCSPFSLLQSSQAIFPTFLTYQSQDGPFRFTFTPSRLRSTSLRR